MLCREEQTAEGPVVIYQTVYFEDVNLPAWIVNPTVGRVLWGTVKGFARSFREFQEVYNTLPAEDLTSQALAHALRERQAAKQAQAQAQQHHVDGAAHGHGSGTAVSSIDESSATATAADHQHAAQAPAGRVRRRMSLPQTFMSPSHGVVLVVGILLGARMADCQARQCRQLEKRKR